jgi:hypothetical protein
LLLAVRKKKLLHPLLHLHPLLLPHLLLRLLLLLLQQLPQLLKPPSNFLLDARKSHRQVAFLLGES